MPDRGGSHVFYHAWHGVNRNTQLGKWINRWVHWGGRVVVLWYRNAPWLNIPFLCLIEDHGNVVCIA